MSVVRDGPCSTDALRGAAAAAAAATAGGAAACSCCRGQLTANFAGVRGGRRSHDAAAEVDCSESSGWLLAGRSYTVCCSVSCSAVGSALASPVRERASALAGGSFAQIPARAGTSLMDNCGASAVDNWRSREPRGEVWEGWAKVCV